MSTHHYWAPPPAILDLSIMLSGDASLLIKATEIDLYVLERGNSETVFSVLHQTKKKDDISDTHKSTDQSMPTVVVGIKSSFYQIMVYWLQFNFKLINILMKASG
jgi:hypothetical protein